MVSVIICSCLNKPERLEYLDRCVKNIKYIFDNNVEILIAFDKHGMEIEDTVCYTHNKGMGHSWNWGIQNAKNDYILQIEDDWVIEIGGANQENLPTKESFFHHLENRIKVLEKNDGFFKFTHLGDDIYKTGKTELDMDGYKFLEWKKSEKFMLNTWEIYRYSNQPHLKKKSFHDDIGYYLENEPPHKVEVDMCYKLHLSDKRVYSCPFFTFVHIGRESSREK